jgi:hypothetical protein
MRAVETSNSETTKQSMKSPNPSFGEASTHSKTSEARKESKSLEGNFDFEEDTNLDHLNSIRSQRVRKR